MSEEKAIKPQLPKGYAYYKKTQLEVAGYEKNQPILKALKSTKTVLLSKEQADELNAHKANTLIEYVIKK